jgi:hypothetical protein
VPISGLTWRAESSYLRNEPCDAADSAASRDAAPSASASGARASRDDCAVILTRFAVSQSSSSGEGSTPEDYLRNGLRTSGTWTGSGESLDSISLSNGLLTSSTQSSTQNMDYVILSASTGSSIHRIGKEQNQTQIAFVHE